MLVTVEGNKIALEFPPSWLSTNFELSACIVQSQNDTLMAALHFRRLINRKCSWVHVYAQLSAKKLKNIGTCLCAVKCQKAEEHYLLIGISRHICHVEVHQKRRVLRTWKMMFKLQLALCRNFVNASIDSVGKNTSMY